MTGLVTDDLSCRLGSLEAGGLPGGAAAVRRTGGARACVTSKDSAADSGPTGGWAEPPACGSALPGHKHHGLTMGPGKALLHAGGSVGLSGGRRDSRCLKAEPRGIDIAACNDGTQGRAYYESDPFGYPEPVVGGQLFSVSCTNGFLEGAGERARPSHFGRTISVGVADVSGVSADGARGARSVHWAHEVEAHRRPARKDRLRSVKAQARAAAAGNCGVVEFRKIAGLSTGACAGAPLVSGGSSASSVQVTARLGLHA